MNLFKRLIVHRTNRWLAKRGAPPLQAACPGDHENCPMHDALMAGGDYRQVQVQGGLATSYTREGRRRVHYLSIAASIFVWLLDKGWLPEYDATRQTGWHEAGDNIGGPAPEAGGDTKSSVSCSWATTNRGCPRYRISRDKSPRCAK